MLGLHGAQQAHARDASVVEVPMHGYGLSRDGQTVLGSYKDMPCTWSAARGVTMLEVPGPISRGFACGASRDGKVILGSLTMDDNDCICTWINAKCQIIAPSDLRFGRPFVSADGSTVVGTEANTVRGARSIWVPFAGGRRTASSTLRESSPGKSGLRPPPARSTAP